MLAAQPHTIKGKVVDPRKAKSKTSSKKIFVGGVDSNTEEEALKEYFSRFGKVDGIELPFDKIRNRRREFCFIIFDTKEGQSCHVVSRATKRLIASTAADAACQDSKQFIGGRECDIKRAQPHMNAAARGARGGGRGGGPSSFGHQPHHMAYGQANHYGGWGQPANGFENGYHQAQGGWSNGPRQHNGPGRGGQGGRQFHKPRVYTGSGNENGFHGFG